MYTFMIKLPFNKTCILSSQHKILYGNQLSFTVIKINSYTIFLFRNLVIWQITSLFGVNVFLPLFPSFPFEYEIYVS